MGRARGRNFDYVVAVYSPPGTDGLSNNMFLIIMNYSVGRARGRNFDYVVAVCSPPGTDGLSNHNFFLLMGCRKFEKKTENPKREGT